MNYLIIIIILAGSIALLVLFLSKRQKLSSAELKKIKNNWAKIEQEQDYKKAILEADKLLDYVLTKKKYQGTLGEKLKRSKILFSHINEVWSAHRIRNKIAHEIDFHLQEKEGKRAVASFKKAFKDLRVI
jgi:hypothetical protein